MALFVFNPLMPFRKTAVAEYDYVFHHKYCAISKPLLDKLGSIEISGKELFPLSYSGLKTNVPIVEVGLQIGETSINYVKSYVLDLDEESFKVGKNLVSQILEGDSADSNEGDGTGSNNANVHNQKPETVSPEKNAPDLFSLEIYPCDSPFPCRNLEYFLSNLRKLYNILLVTDKHISRILPDGKSIYAIDTDHSLPLDYILSISSVSNGSIFISLASASKRTLQYLANAFKMGATAKLANELAQAGKAELDLSISQEMREDTKRQLALEAQALSAESIRKTYETWRRDVKSNMKLFNDLIEETHDPKIKATLLLRKDEAILGLVEQQLLPIVRNVPRAAFAGELQAITRSSSDAPLLGLPPPR